MTFPVPLRLLVSFFGSGLSGCVYKKSPVPLPEQGLNMSGKQAPPNRGVQFSSTLDDEVFCHECLLNTEVGNTDDANRYIK